VSRDAGGSVVPAACTPRWGDLPALAWVAARAYAPERGPQALLRVLTASAVPIWMPGFAVLRGRGQLAASGRSAVVAVSRFKNPVWLLLALVVVSAAGLWCVLVTGGWVGLALSAAPVGLGLTVVQAWRVLRAQPALWRAARALRAVGGRQTAIYEVGALAAWPRRRGHGSGLLADLLATTKARGYVVAYPRDEGLRVWYLSLGMVEHEPGGALYLELRGGPVADLRPTRRRRGRAGRVRRSRSGGRSRGHRPGAGSG